MKALVTGIAGQDAFYLQKELLERGYEVLGLYRGQDEDRLDKFLLSEMPEVEFVRGDVSDSHAVNAIIKNQRPDWVFNMAGVTNVPVSLQSPYVTFRVNTEGVLNLLEAIKTFSPSTRMVQASTSEMYGNANSSGGFVETDLMIPTSPYGISKLAAHLLCRNYRVSYGLHVSCAISFNHESPRRPPIFVTRKVTQAVARIIAEKQDYLVLGNMAAQRDWGFAGDYVKAFIGMAEADSPDDYVIGTGVVHSVEDLVAAAFAVVGVSNWRDFIRMSPDNLRPEDNDYLCADPTKAKVVLGWKSVTTFEELVTMMVTADLRREGAWTVGRDSI